MKKKLLSSGLFLCFFLVSVPYSSAATVQWSLAELIQQLQAAQNSKDPLNVLIASKVFEELNKRNIKIVNGNLEFTTPVYPGWRAGEGESNTNDARDDFLQIVSGISPVKYLGSCKVPLPAFSLLAVESAPVDLKTTLEGNGTLFSLAASRGQVKVATEVHGLLKGSADIALEWGGVFPRPTVICVQPPRPPCPPIGPCPPAPPPICVPGPPELVCEDWKDRAGVNVKADIKATAALTLDTSYVVTERQITLNKQVDLSGEIKSVHGYFTEKDPDFGLPKRLIPYVQPDFSMLTGPTPSSPISAGIAAQVTLLPVAAGSVALGAVTALLAPAFALPQFQPLAPLVADFAAKTPGLLLGVTVIGFDEQELLDKEFQKWIAEQNAAFEAKGYNQPIVIQLPDDVDGKLLVLVLRFLRDSGFIDVLVDFTRAHLHEILYYLLTDNRDAIAQLFASAAACEAVKSIRADMNFPQLFVSTQGSCVAADLEGADQGRYFTDAQCGKEVAFRPTPHLEYCRQIFAGKPNAVLGNAKAWTPDINQPNDTLPGVPSQKWTLSLGTQLAVGVESLSLKTAPFMKRVRYRDAMSQGQTTTCALEMRIYKKNLDAANLPALLAIHGGSWAHRGGAFMGLEATVAHYTEQGFAVFVPFYRLAGSADASPECNRAAWNEVTTDAEAALDWIKLNGQAFGAKPGKVALMGQSAGAHLSGWLITHRPDEIERALLLYPPTDTRDFLTEARVGGQYEAFIPSLGILSNFLGTDVTKIDVANPPDFVLQNSFRDLVQNAATPMPPVFILHGKADTIVPSNQSVILCNAYGGTAVNDGGGALLRATYGCGKGQLHLFEEADHALDLCPSTAIPGICRAGSAASATKVAASLSEARFWLKGDIAWLAPLLNLILLAD